MTPTIVTAMDVKLSLTLTISVIEKRWITGAHIASTLKKYQVWLSPPCTKISDFATGGLGGVRPFLNARAKRIERGILARDIGVRLSLVRYRCISKLFNPKRIHFRASSSLSPCTYAPYLFVCSGNGSALKTKRGNLSAYDTWVAHNPNWTFLSRTVLWHLLPVDVEPSCRRPYTWWKIQRLRLQLNTYNFLTQYIMPKRKAYLFP